MSRRLLAFVVAGTIVVAGVAVLLVKTLDTGGPDPDSSAAAGPTLSPYEQSMGDTAQPAPTELSLPATVTFSEHIAPIIFSHCTKCHRPGEPGPFPMLRYADVASRGELIKAMTLSRYMPPWPADPFYRHFVDENVLTDEQIGLIGRWVDQGAPRGDSRREPKPRRFPRARSSGSRTSS